MCSANAIVDGGRMVIGAQAGEGRLVIGAQAGEGRLAHVFRKAGFTRLRRAAEAPFNLIFEAKL